MAVPFFWLTRNRLLGKVQLDGRSLAGPASFSEKTRDGYTGGVS